MSLLNPTLTSFPVYPMVELARRKAALVEQGRPVYDFGTGDPKIPTDQNILTAFHEAVPPVSQYPAPGGSLELRQTFSTWFERRFAVPIDSETEVLITSGSKEAIFHTPFVFIDSEADRRGVLTPDPAYNLYDTGTRFAGGETHFYLLKPEKNYVLDPEDLDLEVVKKSKILWINYPNNPTGAMAGGPQLKAIVDFAQHHQLILCSDECYTELYDSQISDKPHSVLEFARQKILVFQSLSKRSGMTGFRSGVLLGDPELIAAQKSMRAMIGTASTAFVQGAAGAAWSDEEHVKERRQIFDRRRQMLIAFIRDELKFDVSGDQAAIYLWIRLPESMSEKAYAEALLEHGIVVSPGPFFGPAGAGHLRLALVPDEQAIADTISLWRQAVADGLHDRLMTKEAS